MIHKQCVYEGESVKSLAAVINSQTVSTYPRVAVTNTESGTIRILEFKYDDCIWACSGYGLSVEDIASAVAVYEAFHDEP